MKYCNQCGSTVNLRIPKGDNRPRHICDKCGFIHYQNPKLIAGCITEWQDQILLCRRAIEPRYCLWTLPAGFMENEETLEEAAIRETYEEACAEVKIIGLYSVFSLPHVSQVYVIFRGNLINGSFSAGSESLETKLFKEEDIPWNQIAFPVIEKTLKRYFLDRSSNKYFPFTETISSRRRLN